MTFFLFIFLFSFSLFQKINYIFIFFCLGNEIFFTTIDQERKVEIDPFRPSELYQRGSNSLTGAPPKPAAKPRKPSRILREKSTTLNLNTPSIKKQKTDQIRKVKRSKSVNIIYFIKLIYNNIN